MYVIYKCIDKETDGTDSSTIGYCADEILAKRVVLGRGPMGEGNGEIEEMLV